MNLEEKLEKRKTVKAEIKEKQKELRRLTNAIEQEKFRKKMKKV